MNCPRCGSADLRPFGYSAKGIARNRCVTCRRVFENPSRPTREDEHARRQQPRACLRCGEKRFAFHGYGRHGVPINRCLACGRQQRDYSRTRVAGEHRLSAKPGISVVDAARLLVRADVLRVRVDGSIWRYARFDKWGGRHRVDPPVRADVARANGRRRLHFKVGGRQFELNATRLLWVLQHGDVPLGFIVGGARGNIPRLTTRAEAVSDARRVRRQSNGELILDRIKSVPLPAWLPSDLREEIRQEMALMVLTGEATLETLSAFVDVARRRIDRRLKPYQESLSLSAPVKPGSTLTWEGVFPA